MKILELQHPIRLKAFSLCLLKDIMRILANSQINFPMKLRVQNSKFKGLLAMHY